jgi:hypothetical protein
MMTLISVDLIISLLKKSKDLIISFLGEKWQIKIRRASAFPSICPVSCCYQEIKCTDNLGKRK